MKGIIITACRDVINMSGKYSKIIILLALVIVVIIVWFSFARTADDVASAYALENISANYFISDMDIEGKNSTKYAYFDTRTFLLNKNIENAVSSTKNIVLYVDGERKTSSLNYSEGIVFYGTTGDILSQNDLLEAETINASLLASGGSSVKNDGLIVTDKFAQAYDLYQYNIIGKTLEFAFVVDEKEIIFPGTYEVTGVLSEQFEHLSGRIDETQSPAIYFSLDSDLFINNNDCVISYYKIYLDSYSGYENVIGALNNEGANWMFAGADIVDAMFLLENQSLYAGRLTSFVGIPLIIILSLGAVLAAFEVISIKRRSLGLLMALGNSPKRSILIFSLEVMLILIIALFIALCISGIIVAILNEVTAERFYLNMTITSQLFGLGIAVAAAVIGALWCVTVGITAIIIRRKEISDLLKK